MHLFLRVIDARDMSASSMSAMERKKVFACQGGTIGRDPRCFWVLPDVKRFVSFHHAVVEYENSNYYLTDTSTNGVYLNKSSTQLGRGNRVELGDGDNFSVGDYEILVGLVQEVSAADANVKQRAARKTTFASGQDPMELFDGNNLFVQGTVSDFGDQEPGPTIGTMDQNAGLDEHFSPPEVEVDKQIPDDWASMTYMPLPDSEGAGNELLSSDQGNYADKKSAAAPSQNFVAGGMRPDHPASRSKVGGQSGLPADERYQKLLQAMGIDIDTISPELVKILPEMLGLLVRECVSGLREVLEVRNSLKSALRLDQTLIQPSKNNPLKFSSNVDEALKMMLSTNDRGYLTALEAIRGGFDDIKSHQLGMMAGMQGALQDILLRFDPDMIEQRIKLSRTGIMAPNKSKYWELYKKQYDDIVQEAMDNFQSLLGDGFNKSYAEQIRKIELVARDLKKPK